MATKITLSKTAQAKLEREARKKCKELAQESRDALEEKYLEVVDEFYDELTPMTYIRHEDRGQGYSRGLKRTYKPIYKKDNDAYKGGIIITDKYMYDGYNGTHAQVLWSFLMGFHGLPHDGYIKDISKDEDNYFHGKKLLSSKVTGNKLSTKPRNIKSMFDTGRQTNEVYTASEFDIYGIVNHRLLTGAIKPLKEMRTFYEKLIERMKERV